MNRLKSAVFIMLFLTAFMLLNCRTTAYIPSPAYTPFMGAGNDLQLGASVNVAKDDSEPYQNESAAFHLAYRPGARFLIAASGNYSEEMKDIDLMFGGFTNDPFASLALEIFGGYGYTDLNHATYYHSYAYSGRAHRFFGQFGLMSKSNPARFGAYSRLTVAALKTVATDHNTLKSADGGLVLEAGPVIRLGIADSHLELKAAGNLQIGSARATEFTYGLSFLHEFSFTGSEKQSADISSNPSRTTATE